jgi:beta-galactosidase
MAIAQATKTAGKITVDASSPGLAPASVTVSTKAVTLRPQVAVWEREIPKGAGITGLWRPAPGAPGATGMMAFLVGDGTNIFTLRQDGSTLTGSVEGLGGGFFGGSDAGIPIEEGKVDGQSVSFKVGTSTFSGTLKGDQLELERTIDLSRFLSRMPKEPAGSRPAIGPPPDGTDPSFNMPARMPASSIPVVLRRAQR